MNLIELKDKIGELNNRIPRLELELSKINGLGLNLLEKEYSKSLKESKKELSVLEKEYERLENEELIKQKLSNDKRDYEFAIGEINKLESMVTDMKKALEGNKVEINIYRGFNNGNLFKLQRTCTYFSNQLSDYISKIQS